MTIFHAIILGIVEGLTEFLPVSSTGHLILAGKFLGLPGGNFEKSFDIIIQLGAILSVVVLYWRVFLRDIPALKKICVAFLPTAVIGLALYKFIKQLMGSEWVIVWALFLGGVILIVFEHLYKKKPKMELVENISQISYKNAFLIGLFQAISVIPGVSRSGATIVGGLSLGIKRETIVEFSFLLAVPTMCAATGLDLVKNWRSFSADDAGILAAGFVTSFIVALVCIKLFLGFVRKYDFTSFGIYRIVVAIIAAFLLW
ncbi:MAG: undecaprenyl-diphosphate phosphatase [Candidatus Paceibacterota bacterium]|jgi:undecaprenyl-diphosphatase|nr:undecaprenyl-diphosphate phosphatase [Candidatus Paceibacterota bacterium]